jgi:protein-S-isoprenylcysteine O-methyltransferase Ste14
VRRRGAALGSLLFFLVAPAFVGGAVPWLLTGWHVGHPAPHWLAARVLGGAFVVAGAGVVVHAFVRFVVDGHGTPAPVAPPDQLVVTGAYRYVRNPMYVAVASVIVGQALLLGRLWLLAYAAGFLMCTMAFVYWYEQPKLRRQFPKDYPQYAARVPGWVPHVRPYRGD